MNCQVVLELLSPYLDGVLDPVEHATVQKHLASCPACSRELAELKACIDLLQELPDIAPPADFRAGLMEKIDRLPSSTKSNDQRNWFDCVNGVTRKSWYRTVAVAAVMVMTLGVTSLWQNEGHQLIPVPNEAQEIAEQTNNQQARQEPLGDLQTTKPTSDTVTKSVNKTPSKGKVEATNTKSQGFKAVPKQAEKATPVTLASQNDRRFVPENYQPQPSIGMTARSVTLKLGVQDQSEALKSIGSITQSNNGSIMVPYNESNGKLAIKVPVQTSRSVESQLKQLGQVITDMPSERDLSGQHEQAVNALEQLKVQQSDLQKQLSEQSDPGLEQQLANLTTVINQQIGLIQRLEQQSNYSVITVTIE
ncbi:putative transmembrane anti-sigma factor [Desulforamulus reducens MI-1]|uniref:Anti-sigma-W factor RsiW n=1 Tax=Desulforamulus reducens (strain ATCC BAA-1160 / DSM 100696 / MI-1) TaxID=349161 RepID=A4J0I7_DESRM|nr:zf-HC2 domain-containing protein [Desulforamulus reducens]ABO48590.1 putative transmembrane anti-sigma factor [Desulforamulus reducens MI-1]